MIDPRLDTEPRPLWPRIAWIALPAALLVSGLLAAHALAAGAAPAAGWAASHFGHLARSAHGDHAGGWGRDPEHARFAADWVLRGVGADEQQRERIGSVVEAALSDLQAMGAQHRERRDAWVAAFSAPAVDPEEIEALRRAELALADAASRRIADVLLEVASVLDPEQRAELLEALDPFHGHRGRGHRRRS